MTDLCKADERQNCLCNAKGVDTCDYPHELILKADIPVTVECNECDGHGYFECHDDDIGYYTEPCGICMANGKRPAIAKVRVVVESAHPRINHLRMPGQQTPVGTVDFLLKAIIKRIEAGETIKGVEVCYE